MKEGEEEEVTVPLFPSRLHPQEQDVLPGLNYLSFYYLKIGFLIRNLSFNAWQKIPLFYAYVTWDILNYLCFFTKIHSLCYIIFFSNLALLCNALKFIPLWIAGISTICLLVPWFVWKDLGFSSFLWEYLGTNTTKNS